MLFPILPLIIMLFSGCTSITTASGKGVMVKEFAPDFSEIYSGEPVTFRLLLKNEGSVEAKGAHAELLGLDEDWCSSTGGCRSSGGGRLEKLPNEPECQYEGGGFSMPAPNPLMGTAGGTQICTWTYSAPVLDKGFTITYMPVARVFYSYKSAVTKLITFGSTSELRRMQDSGGTLPSETSSSTESPVQLSIQTSGPIRFWEDSVAFPLEVTITNAGGGIPCSSGAASHDGMKDACKAGVSGEDAKNKVTLRITMDSMTKLMDEECQPLESGKTISLLKSQNSFVCDIEASGLSEIPSQRTIKVEAFYEYFTDTQTTIKVTGRRSTG
jgi:hypothetical protein